MTTITFGSVCSGLEAASVAWHRFGWRAAWLAEVEPNPAKLLHHHYGSGRPHYMLDPDAEGLEEDERKQRRAMIKAVAKLPLVPAHSTAAPPNLGDMTRIEAMVRAGQVAAPDILCGGTPCQAFSFAGLRDSLDDSRGQLTLSFVRLADAIDAARSVQRKPAAVVVWENVKGVLSTKDNAFGAFLGALAGEDGPLEPPGTGWPNAGCVFGPKRTIAWRVFDAQYFNVAQRRERVFVVASTREDVDPSQILLEFDGVRRDSPPSRGAPEGAARGFEISPSSGRFTDVAPTLDCRAKNGPVQNQIGAGVLQPIVSTLDASYGRLQGCSGQDANHGHSHLVVAYGGNNQAGPIEVATACRAHGSPHLDFESETFLVQPLPIAFDSRQECVSSTEVFGALGSSSPQAQAVSYAIQAGALRTNPNSGPDGVGVQADIAYTIEARAEVQAVCLPFDTTQITSPANRSNPQDGDPCHPLAAGAHPPAIVAATLDAAAGRSRGAGTPIGMLTNTTMAVRRLTPRECERLQGFPDDYTLIPIRQISAKRAAKLRADGDPVLQVGDEYWELTADGPRYKALGNSWAVPNVVWIGNRINQVLRAQMLENAA